MSSNSSGDHKFTWGDTLIIKKSAPAHLHPGEIVSVCSVVKIDAEDIEKKPTLVETTWFYTVEFGNGSSIELPECYLEAYVDDKKNKFDYGETARISTNAPENYYPSEIGFICGMIDIDSDEASIAYDCVGSNWLYTVELLSGKSLQIPEKYLEKDKSSNSSKADNEQRY